MYLFVYLFMGSDWMSEHQTSQEHGTEITNPGEFRYKWTCVNYFGAFLRTQTTLSKNQDPDSEREIYVFVVWPNDSIVW